MKKLIRILVIISAIALVGTGLYFRYFRATVTEPPVPETPAATVPEPFPEQPAADTPAPEPTLDDQASEAPAKSTEKSPVPFIVQAPNAKWDNPIFQDGCEEASMLMAMDWIQGTKSVSATEAADAITRLAAFEVSRLGHHQDVSLPEIVTVLGEYFHYDRAKLLNGVTLPDIRRELDDGNVVLIPTFGQALRNPNYTAPGPITHMLVVIGYDPGKRQFIVNDPGTRRGENYRYDENVLFDAIWAYPTGMTHPPIPTPSERQKSVIVIRSM